MKIFANLLIFIHIVIASRPEHLVSSIFEIVDDGTNDKWECKGRTCLGAHKLLNELCYVQYSDGLTTYDFVGVRNKKFLLDRRHEFNCTATTKDASSWVVTRKSTGKNELTWWGPKHNQWTPTILYMTSCVFRNDGHIYFGSDMGKCCNYAPSFGLLTCDWWRV